MEKRDEPSLTGFFPTDHQLVKVTMVLERYIAATGFDLLRVASLTITGTGRPPDNKCSPPPLLRSPCEVPPGMADQYHEPSLIQPARGRADRSLRRLIHGPVSTHSLQRTGNRLPTIDELPRPICRLRNPLEPGQFGPIANSLAENLTILTEFRIQMQIPKRGVRNHYLKMRR